MPNMNCAIKECHVMMLSFVVCCASVAGTILAADDKNQGLQNWGLGLTGTAAFLLFCLQVVDLKYLGPLRRAETKADMTEAVRKGVSSQVTPLLSAGNDQIKRMAIQNLSSTSSATKRAEEASKELKLMKATCTETLQIVGKLLIKLEKQNDEINTSSRSEAMELIRQRSDKVLRGVENIENIFNPKKVGKTSILSLFKTDDNDLVEDVDEIVIYKKSN